jgi:cytochrome c oxidase subunit 2
MMKRLLILLIFTACCAQLFAGGDANAGKARFAVCVACHQMDGSGNKDLMSPAIAGQEDWYVKRQLQYFKDGIRGTNPKHLPGIQMRPMAQTLATDKDVEDMAAYIKSMKPVKTKHQGLGGDPAKGKTYYVICSTCHGMDAKGLVALNGPNLTLQQDWYLYTQIKNFKEGIRGSDPKDIYGQQMKPMALTLPDDQAIKDVVAYITSLP